MNSEDMIQKASAALKFFQTRHTGTAYLYYKDGHVVCWDGPHRPHKVPNELTISEFQQKIGLTSNQWHSVGTTLINLRNKELLCQAHPKP